MKVLTYIKDLPVKLTNENKNYIDLEGATLYLDEEGNRYAYVCFNNLTKKPFFALILNLTQYDVGGHLITKEKYYVPHCYGERGKYILEKPIKIDKECEGMEIEIALAVFARRIFANNEMRAKGSVLFEFPRLGNNDPLLPRGNASNFAWPTDTQEVKEEPAPIAQPEPAPVEEEVKEEKAFEFPKEEEKAAPAVEEKKKEVKEEVKEPTKEEPLEEKVEEAPIQKEEEVAQPEPVVEGKYVSPEPKKKDTLLKVVLPIVVGVLSLAVFLAVLFIVKGVVPSTPFRP